jgi:hypothetical protein
VNNCEIALSTCYSITDNKYGEKCGDSVTHVLPAEIQNRTNILPGFRKLTLNQSWNSVILLYVFTPKK